MFVTCLSRTKFSETTFFPKFLSSFLIYSLSSTHGDLTKKSTTKNEPEVVYNFKKNLNDVHELNNHGIWLTFDWFGWSKLCSVESTHISLYLICVIFIPHVPHNYMFAPCTTGKRIPPCKCASVIQNSKGLTNWISSNFGSFQTWQHK